MLNRAAIFPLLLGAVCMVLLSACTSSTTEGGGAKVPVPPASMFFEREYNFCSEMIQDRFTIGYYGNNVLESPVHFYIVCHRGDTIFQDTWPGHAFLTGVPDSLSGTADSSKVAYVHAAMLDLIEGRMPAPADSLISATAARGRTFSYQVADVVSRRLVFDASSKKVLEL